MLRCILPCCLLLVSVSLFAQPKTNKTVFIIVDGIRLGDIVKSDRNRCSIREKIHQSYPSFLFGN